ncbi:MAG: immunity 26 domain-containing protein [Tannerella sp.]|jgi:hypothetical protein|nr:immunity 26 domain-containing protein [Tannerella sp.]
MEKKKLKEGDIFYVKINDKYIFGKILIDISERILKLESQHKYKFYSGCYLATVFSGIYDDPILTTTEIILPSQFTFKRYFYSKQYKVEWFFYEHQPIDYTKIDFPEVLETGDNGLINFRKCDVSIPTKTLYKNFPRQNMNDSPTSIQNYTGCLCPSFYQMADDAIHLQGRDDLLRDKERTDFISKNDLRLSIEDRARFYAEIGEDPNQSYYEMALKYGFDLARFY